MNLKNIEKNFLWKFKKNKITGLQNFRGVTVRQYIIYGIKELFPRPTTHLISHYRPS